MTAETFPDGSTTPTPAPSPDNPPTTLSAGRTAVPDAARAAADHAALREFDTWTRRPNRAAYVADLARTVAQAAIEAALPHLAAEPARAIVVLDIVRDTVHGVTTDDTQARQWCHDLTVQHRGHPLAARQHVAVIGATPATRPTPGGPDTTHLDGTTPGTSPWGAC